MIVKRLQALFNPDHYHGWGKKRKYFEGWYYKILNKDRSVALAIIPGIAMDEDGKQQAFVQVLDGLNYTAEYHRFESSDFKAKPDRFEVSIATNQFTDSWIKLDLPGLKGQLQLSNLVRWPNTFYSPGIMGPFSFVPFMECYHGVVSMNHEISGALNFKDQDIDFNEGRGYMEKDWGKSFPEAYVWMQSNHFSEPNISLKASVAKIPWLGSYFIGFIAGIWLRDKLISFTTYNFSSITKTQIDKSQVELVFKNKNYKLEILVERDQATALASPILGLMDGRIEESMSSTMKVRLTDRSTNKLLLNDTGNNTALEVAGKIETLIK